MFVFYDTETTGLNRDFCQILQISLVFTDDDLNVLSSTKLECRRSPWIIPSPGALLITGFVPDDLKKNKYSHYEMMKEVDGWIRQQHWPVTFVGYNSFGYDEPLLAQNFHQTLFDTDLTSAKNNAATQSNGRADVMALVQAAALYMPGALKLDILNAYNKPSHSLQNVAQQNGVSLTDGDAHDSMNDIKATIGVAKILQKAAPQVWAQAVKLATPEGRNEFLKHNKVFTCATGKTKTAVMTSLSGETLYDLSVDPTPYLGMTEEQLKDVLLSGGKQNPFLSAQRHNLPLMMPMEHSEAVLLRKYDEKLYAARAEEIRSNKEFIGRVEKAAILVRQANIVPDGILPELLVEKEIPAAVRSKLDAWKKEFHAAPDWTAASLLLKDFYARFEDDLKETPSISRFVKFAARIVYEHAPEVLDTEKQDAMKKHIAGRLLNPETKVPYMTVAKAREELKTIEQERAGGEKRWAHVTDSQIRSLKLYYTSLEKEFAAFASPAPVNDNTSVAPEIKKPFNGNIRPK